MSKNTFNAVTTIEQTRASLQKRLGEIITDLFGKDDLQKLFENGGAPAGEASGELALQQNLISKDTKTAILVAQAAERAWNLSTEAAELARNAENTIKQYRESETRFDYKAHNVVEYNDDVFKFVGSDRDPDILKTAQSAWLTAQVYYNIEVVHLNDRINSPGYVGYTESMGEEYESGFKSLSASLYATAADMLKKEGHDTAAAKLSAVAADLSGKTGPENKFTPAGLISSHLWREAYAAQQVNIILSGDYQSVSSDYENRMEKIKSFLPQEQNHEKVLKLTIK